jgi:ferredoxin-nitrate reductase
VPNIEVAKKAGLTCNRGVVVNDVMQTSDPAIFAIGEIVEWNRQLFGIVAAAEQQAGIAASFINGDTTQLYTGTLSANMLKISGVNVCSIGINEMPKDNPEYQEVVFTDKRLRHYKKCIIHNDKLVGAILIGDKSELMEFKDWMANDIFLEEKRDRILRDEGSKGGATTCLTFP